MGLIFREQRSRKTPAAKDDQRDAAKLPKELGYAYGEAGPVDKAGNPFIEESGLKLNAEKLRIVGIKSRVQIALYSGKIDTVILDTWVVAHHSDCKRRERQNEANIAVTKLLHFCSVLTRLKSAPSGGSLRFRSCRGETDEPTCPSVKLKAPL
jgi:hypothetical protein